MTLLREVTESPLDPSYAEAARRQRTGHHHAAARGTQRILTLVLAVALGIGLVTAIVSLREPTGVRDRARELLVGQVEERSALQEQLTTDNAALTAEIAQLSTLALGTTDPALVAQLEVLGIVSGVTPVEGDAYVLTFSDSQQAAQDPAAYPEERVTAVDLQIVVNALWAGGAEAITVNGTRVSGSGAIRGAGSAILVDLVPVTSPYEVIAIGDVGDVRRSVASSSAAAHMSVLRDRYRIGITSGTRDDVRMPGVRTTQPRFAVALGTGETGDGDGDDQPPEELAPPGAGGEIQ
ncbi:DUF881 domain-containing protein [Serinibacter arcticus]|uniref:DUF881 domain-containing protein n=2 Tax=Serinibacter arcticus TaxID=1655435 RepID=A0A2U1ZRX5_9MICO|nr:DUF881 domain-containing protein [Serinibacter arcticus]